MKSLDELRWTSMMLFGEITPMCTSGQVAASLGIAPSEFQRWLRKGWIPNTPFLYRYRYGTGRWRRLYLREQVEGIVRIAQQERVCAPDFRPPDSTDFARKIAILFASLRERYER